MNERKDDIIIGLLVVIIVLQVYGLFLGNNTAQMNGSWQNYGAQEVTTLPADGAGAQPADVNAGLGDTVKPIDANNDPSSGANVPGAPAGKKKQAAEPAK